jgi:alginate production protein
MLKFLIFLTLLLMNNLYAQYFSIQYSAFRNKNYAYEHKNKYCKKKCFIYINKNYYTVREGIFSSIKAAKNYAKFNELKDYIIVPIDLTKLNIRSINKRRKNKIAKKCDKLEKKLTPCRNGVCNRNKNKRYPWEYNVSSLKITPKVPNIQLYENSVKNENNKSKIENEFSRFYFDFYGKAGYGQKEYNKQRIKDLKLVSKLGMQYGFNFLDNYHFYTDDRFIVSYDNYNNNISNGAYFDINELYVNSYDLFYNMFDFVIGRKIIKDYNSLFYNSSLDLVGFYNLHDLLLYKLYFGTRLNNFKIKDDNNAFGVNTKNIRFLILQAEYQYYLNHYLTFLYQYENSNNTQMREKRKGNWVSLRSYNTSYNKDGDKLFYYGNIAMLNGKKNTQNSNRGSEFLAGIMYEPSTWLNKGIGASFVYSSRDYFQPYIANNKSNFLSKDLSFRYFGEFLDPELSNIDILSLYYKNIIDKNSLYLFSLHKYWKNAKDRDIYSSRYIIPTGANKDVGQEANFLYKYLQKNYYWQFCLSYFLGGKAFNQAQEKDGIGAKINFRYYW